MIVHPSMRTGWKDEVREGPRSEHFVVQVAADASYAELTPSFEPDWP